MKIKNNRKNFVILQMNDGMRKMIQKIKPSEVIEIPYLKDMGQVVNKFLFSNGNLSVVNSTDVAVKKGEPNTKKPTEKNKVSKKSKVEKAIAKADDFMDGDVSESEKIQKVKSSKNKTKKEEK